MSQYTATINIWFISHKLQNTREASSSSEWWNRCLFLNWQSWLLSATIRMQIICISQLDIWFYWHSQLYCHTVHKRCLQPKTHPLYFILSLLLFYCSRRYNMICLSCFMHFSPTKKRSYVTCSSRRYLNYQKGSILQWKIICADKAKKIISYSIYKYIFIFFFIHLWTLKYKMFHGFHKKY